jgi:hypothetical protein
MACVGMQGFTNATKCLPPGPARRIYVFEATYGANCGPDIPTIPPPYLGLEPVERNNATQAVSNECDGTSVCDYRVDYQVLGDPAPGCAKQFYVNYACGNASGVSEDAVHLSAEAGFGSVAHLHCP